MKSQPLRLCWLDLGDGTVCERLAGHEPPCSPDPSIDFPVSTPAFLDDDDFWAGVRSQGDSVRRRLGERLDGELAEIGESWDCPHCDWPLSVNPNDVANHYCGHCHHYCDEVTP